MATPNKNKLPDYWKKLSNAVQGDLDTMRKMIFSRKFIKGAVHAFWFLVGLALARTAAELLPLTAPNQDTLRIFILFGLSAALFFLIKAGK
jgi:hypothetical protein